MVYLSFLLILSVYQFPSVLDSSVNKHDFKLTRFCLGVVFAF